MKKTFVADLQYWFKLNCYIWGTWSGSEHKPANWYYKILQKKLEAIQLKFNTSFCNKNITNVLIENQSQSNPEYYFGRSAFLQPVYVKAKNLDVGDIVPIGIETCNHKSLYGTIIH